MSDIHILEGNRSRGRITKALVFHYLVPAPDRVAAAAQDPGLIAFTSVVPDIASYANPENGTETEEDAVQQGILLEVSMSATFHASESGATLLAKARAMWNANEQSSINNYKARYWNYLNDYAES
jgi:hypothetical protein